MNTNPSVLILDDMELLRNCIAARLDDFEWTSVAAANLDEAYALLKDNHVDAAIVDIQLGKEDGTEFVRKAARQYPNLMFVMCTGNPGYKLPPDLANLPQVSPNVFLKPIEDMDDLIREVERTLATSK